MNDVVFGYRTKSPRLHALCSYIRHALSIAATIALYACGAAACASDAQQLASQILESTAVRGGLIVNGARLSPGDGLALEKETGLVSSGDSEGDFLLFDLA